MRRKTSMRFTKGSLKNLLRTTPTEQYALRDEHEDSEGLSVLVSPGPLGRKRPTVTFRVAYYLKSDPGKARYYSLERLTDETDLDKVRDRAKLIRIAAKNDGVDPKRPPVSDRFDVVVDAFIEGHAKKHNKHWAETRRIFDRYVLPDWRDKRIGEIKRFDVTLLLDKVEQRKVKGPDGKMFGGAVTADATLAALSKLFNWHAARTDDFVSPIVRGMRRTKPKELARDRVLDDAEIRALWSACDDLGAYGALTKTLLLTAQRLRKVQHMRRSAITDDGVWDATDEDDAANKQASVVPLSEMAREIIDSVPIIDTDKPEDFVFSVNGRKPLGGFSKPKEMLDEKMRAVLAEQDRPLKPWRQHDLRRTARTLLSRAGVDRDIAERCLGHLIPGVEGTYNRHHYREEKSIAFEKLAALVQRIVNPPEGSNVVSMRRG